MYAGRAEGDSIEVHIMDYLVHYPAVSDVLQLHTGRVFLFKLAEHRPEVREFGVRLFFTAQSSQYSAHLK